MQSGQPDIPICQNEKEMVLILSQPALENISREDPRICIESPQPCTPRIHSANIGFVRRRFEAAQ